MSDELICILLYGLLHCLPLLLIVGLDYLKAEFSGFLDIFYFARLSVQNISLNLFLKHNVKLFNIQLIITPI